MDDAAARAQALDISRSFIVQAPAGSGKTTLLIQRYLALLGKVEKSPEEVLAVTFTRKAAAEMRVRIAEALALAEGEKPKSSPDLQTWQLAKTVLERDAAEGWAIRENPLRLRVMTIDSLSTWLASALPLSARLCTKSSIAENAEAYYQQAVMQMLNHHYRESPFEPLTQLLERFDGRIESLTALLCQLLRHRDQWLFEVVQSKAGAQKREQLENTFSQIIESAYQRAASALSPYPAFKTLYQYARAQLQLSEDLPAATVEFGDEWQWIRAWLLSKEGKYRKKVTKAQGFLAPSSVRAEEKEQCKAMKDQMQSLLEMLNEDPAVKEALLALDYLPALRYQEAQWAMVEYLHAILPRLVAELYLVFKASGTVDFISLTQGAIDALVGEEGPSDVLLRLDNKICHLLVDEFQDTSLEQFRLLSALITGWAGEAGRSVFLVGDPMQSIYRFRGAEVGLFLKVMVSGIAGIDCVPLRLSANYRAQSGLVEWFNPVFASIFPKQLDISIGACPYYPAQAAKPSTALPVRWINTDSNDDLLATLKDIRQADPKATISILLRNRSHGRSLIRQAKKQALPLVCVDMEPLHAKPWIQDLHALTCAWLNFSDRLAWTSLLRCPLIGLNLKDILSLTDNPKTNLIWENLLAYTGSISIEQERWAYCKSALTRWYYHRNQHSLSDTILGLWDVLGGPAVYPHAETDVLQYLSILESLSADNAVARESIEEALSDQYANEVASPGENPIQVMTIHKAKGLEFDYVLIPGIDRASRASERPLLAWHEHLSSEKTHWLVAAKPGIGQEKDAIYDYLHHQNHSKIKLEETRLLYVALTRAKKQLILATDIESEKAPPKGSFLAKLYDSLPAVEDRKLVSEKRITLSQYKRYRVPISQARLSFMQKSEDSFIDKENQAWQESFTLFESQEARANRLAGIFIHQLYELMAKQGIDAWRNIEINALSPAWVKMLLQMGAEQKSLPEMLKKIKRAVKTILECKIGNWILQSHDYSQSEWEICYLKKGLHQNIIIDRAFKEGDWLWIIDYKTTEAHEESIDAHQRQLLHYANVVRYPFNKIKLGVYYPMNPPESRWIHWRAVALRQTLLPESN